MKERNQEYFITLTGAKKNAGDFLITERALKLLNYVAPEFEYRVRASWNELHDIDEVNNSKGIIVLGGPGYGMNIYPGVYKLRKDLNDIQVPVYILGSGWYMVDPVISLLKHCINSLIRGKSSLEWWKEHLLD